MGKAFGGLGGGSMPRPMPNPRLNPPAAPGAPAPKPAGGGLGLFPNMPVQQRYDMAMDLLKNGMQMGANSGSPLAAFLSPLAGAAIGGGISNKFEGLKSKEEEEMLAAMMPGGVSPRIKELSAILESLYTPDYLKKLAQAELDTALKPMMPGAAPRGGGVGGGKPKTKRPTSTDVLLASILYQALDPSGDGGDTITPAEQAKIDAINTARYKAPKVTTPVVPTPSAAPGVGGVPEGVDPLDWLYMSDEDKALWQ